MSTTHKHHCKYHGCTDHKYLSNGADRKKRRTCIRCLRERQIRVRRGKKLRLVALAGGKCKLCGYDKWPHSLDFHHLDRSTKEYGLANIANRDFEICKKEIEKCILICKNCHGEIETGYEPTLQKLAEYQLTHNVALQQDGKPT